MKGCETMSKIKESLQSCSAITSSIMDEFAKQCEKKKFNFKISDNGAEIRVYGKPKKEVKKLIDNLPWEKKQIKMLLYINEAGNTSFVRLKFN